MAGIRIRPPPDAAAPGTGPGKHAKTPGFDAGGAGAGDLPAAISARLAAGPRRTKKSRFKRRAPSIGEAFGQKIDDVHDFRARRRRVLPRAAFHLQPAARVAGD